MENSIFICTSFQWTYTFPYSICLIVMTFLFLLGNGPNALSLSYLLSGNEPYYIPHQHPNTILDQKLYEECGKSLLDSVSKSDILGTRQLLGDSRKYPPAAWRKEFTCIINRSLSCILLSLVVSSVISLLVRFTLVCPSEVPFMPLVFQLKGLSLALRIVYRQKGIGMDIFWNDPFHCAITSYW